jgi:hypothetical protein
MIGYLKDYELTTEIIFPKDGTGFRGSELSGLLNRDIYQQTSHKFMRCKRYAKYYGGGCHGNR